MHQLVNGITARQQKSFLKACTLFSSQQNKEGRLPSGSSLGFQKCGCRFLHELQKIEDKRHIYKKLRLKIQNPQNQWVQNKSSSNSVGESAPTASTLTRPLAIPRGIRVVKFQNKVLIL